MAVVLVDKLNKSYIDHKGNKIEVLDNLTLNVESEEFVTILGPSGCGKSTLFKILTGIEQQDNGLLQINGSLGYMPQKDMLMPWRKVIDNSILGLELQGIGKEEAKKRALELMRDFGLEDFSESYPHELSGGMRQRVALLRTILPGQPVLLLDEPFGALDAITRFKMQLWLLKVCRKYKRTVLFITHDIEEALFLSDRIYVFSERPATVKLNLKVDLPQERTKETLVNSRFVELKEQLLKVL